MRPTLPTAIIISLVAVSCGGGSDTAVSNDTTVVPTVASAGAIAPSDAITVVTPQHAADLVANPPEDLVILDVRTQEEFDAGHIEGAVMLDFYRDDFADEFAKLDPDVPYVLYCRSGNRSGQTRALMEGLEFQSVADVDGGIIAWQDAGLDVAD